jgi:hypothetical protein
MRGEGGAKYVTINPAEGGKITRKHEQVEAPASASLMARLLGRRSHFGQRPGPPLSQHVTINPSGEGGTRGRTSWTVPRSSIDASMDDPFECEEGGNAKAGILTRITYVLFRFIVYFAFC